MFVLLHIGAGECRDGGEPGASGAAVWPEGAGGHPGEVRQTQRQADSADKSHQTALLWRKSTGEIFFPPLLILHNIHCFNSSF